MSASLPGRLLLWEVAPQAKASADARAAGCVKAAPEMRSPFAALKRCCSPVYSTCVSSLWLLAAPEMRSPFAAAPSAQTFWAWPSSFCTCERQRKVEGRREKRRGKVVEGIGKGRRSKIDERQRKGKERR